MKKLTPAPANNNFHFSFKTTYLGRKINLRVEAGADRYAVSLDDKTIGHIKPGHPRHTWFVVDSNFVAPCLVDEIGNRIEEHTRLQQSA